MKDSLNHARAAFVVACPSFFSAGVCCCFRQRRKSASLHSTILSAEFTTWSGVLWMNAAYFSTATAIGSCNSYSRFTISGGLLMIDMSSPSFLLFLWPNSTRAKQMGWSDRHDFRGNKVGSLQPDTVFCPRPK